MNLTFQLVEKLWFNELGCEQSDLKQGRTAVFPHGTLKGYSGVIAFFRDDACIVSAPDYLVKELKEKLDHVDPKTAFTIDGLRSAIGARVERVIGPGWLASIVPQDYNPCHGSEARILEPKDLPAFQRFLSECPAEEVDVSSLDLDQTPVAGILVDCRAVDTARLPARNLDIKNKPGSVESLHPDRWNLCSKTHIFII